MREFKFKAWDKTNRKMLPVCDINWIEVNAPHSIDFITLWDDEINTGYTLDTCDNAFELMQYTGLKDKNSKEGYHNDICRDKNRNLLQIEWIETDAMFALLFVKDGKFTGASMPMRYLGECEDIGNIYKNPDLLGGK